LSAGEGRPVRRVLVSAVVLFVVHAAGARAIDALGIADRMLAGGAGALGLVALVAAFLALRLVVFFVVPGLVLGTLALALAQRLQRERAATR
jgi:hypothetical protein